MSALEVSYTEICDIVDALEEVARDRSGYLNKEAPQSEVPELTEAVARYETLALKARVKMNELAPAYFAQLVGELSKVSIVSAERAQKTPLDEMAFWVTKGEKWNLVLAYEGRSALVSHVRLEQQGCVPGGLPRLDDVMKSLLRSAQLYSRLTPDEFVKSRRLHRDERVNAYLCEIQRQNAESTLTLLGDGFERYSRAFAEGLLAWDKAIDEEIARQIEDLDEPRGVSR